LIALVCLSWAADGSDGAYRAAEALCKSDPARYFFLDQYSASANWRAHYHTTGLELWIQTSGQITHFVCGIGTSGTIMGTGRFLKESDPSIQIIRCNPRAAQPASAGRTRHL
jgi:S-sulfo-L-cysteine synthase (O-acetyl-L-serine-dependent)